MKKISDEQINTDLMSEQKDRPDREKIAEIIRYADSEENPVLIPEYLKDDYLKAADKILALLDICEK